MYQLDWSVVWRNSALLTDGLMVTLELSIVALSVSVLIGIAMAYARLSPHRMVSGAASAYVEFVRNIPLLFFVLFWYFGVLAALPAPRESLSFLARCSISCSSASP